MNIQWDNHQDSLTRRYRELLYAFGLTQNVRDATHIRGHTLDHILTRDSDNLKLTDVYIGDLVSDHKLVCTSVSVNKPEPEVSEVRFRKIKDINISNLKDDIVASDLYKNYLNMDLVTLVQA